MIRVLIIFSILAYLIPGAIVARAYYTDTIDKYRRFWKREAKNKYPSNTSRQDMYFRAKFGEETDSIEIGALLAFLFWPIFFVARFINSGERVRTKRLQQIELKLVELDSQIELFKGNPETMRVLQKEREAVLNEIEMLSD